MIGFVHARRATIGGLLGALTLAGPAHAGQLLDTAVSAGASKARACADGIAPARAAGVALRSLAVPADGYLSISLKAGRGDWDVAAFDRRTGRLVAGAAGSGAAELAQGFVRRGQRLSVQACRRRGSARTAQLTASLVPVGREDGKGLVKIVRIDTPTREHVERLTTLGLDLTEHGDDHHREAVIYTAAQERLLRAAGFSFTVPVPDLEAATKADRRANARYAAEVVESDLPSGRDSYRRLVDFQSEMKALAEENPGLVKPLTLPHRSLEGRAIEGIEITSNVQAADGKPVFLTTGVHHAREWPSAENPMEFAYELVKGHKAGDARVTRLLDAARVIVVPVMNVDGYNLSREAPDNRTLYEYKRKNCRVVDGQTPAAGACASVPDAQGTGAGVDPNRNYGGDWGGPGASTVFAHATYRGAGPHSEPEVDNVRKLISSRQVTTFITNHTYGSLVLRPPGIAAFGPAKDEAIYKDLGDSMAGHNAYTSQFSWQLYDTSGTAEAWSYYATGGLGFTFEIHLNNFHQSYQTAVVDEYQGETARGGTGGNRQAYFTALESTANTARHSVIEGKAAPGSKLTVTKQFATTTSRVQPLAPASPWGDPLTFQDKLTSEMTVPKGGHFEWHVNPSTRPDVYGGRLPKGPTTPDVTFTGDGGAPNVTTVINKEITVAPGEDNGAMRVRAEWPTVADDWTLEIFRKKADGSLERLARSAVATRSFEEAETVHAGPGTYVVRMTEFGLGAQPFTATVDFVPPQPPEAWTLTCETPNGRHQTTTPVVVDRGESVDVGPVCVP